MTGAVPGRVLINAQIGGPLSGANRKTLLHSRISGFDPNRTSAFFAATADHGSACHPWFEAIAFTRTTIRPAGKNGFRSIQQAPISMAAPAGFAANYSLNTEK